MKSYEVVNHLLMPADRVIGATFDALDLLGAYQPMRETGYQLSISALEQVYKVLHRLQVEGRDNIPSGGCIITPNHASWLDVEMVAVAAGRRVHFVAKSEFRDWPLLRQAIRATDAIYVRRGGDPNALDEICDAVNAGKAVVIFPEGTIPGEEDIPRWDVEPDTHLLRGRSGAVRVALRTGAPIVPCGVSGTGRAFPPEAWPRMQELPVPRPEPVTVRFGEPIRFPAPEGDLTRDQLSALTKRVMLAISALIDHERNAPAVPAKAASDDALSVDLPAMASARPRDERLPARKAPCGILLLHGEPSHHETLDTFEAMLTRLDVPHRAPILFGPGSDAQSGTPQQSFRLAERALLDLLRYADRAVVVGVSSSALVALELAARHGQRVAGVAAVAPPMPSLRSELLGRLRRDLPPSAQYALDLSRLLSFVRSPLLVLEPKGRRHPPSSALRRLRSRVSSKERTLAEFDSPGPDLLGREARGQVARAVESFVARIIDAAESAVGADAPVQRAAG
ncbi:MAG TPA: 1-acyl-sn-glycerol-3-phosphate acyltransferase [Polyangiaceae bacterium]|nr:1-acyl-sn-glycerol-3-phosphate acyltransferase [Polyangiaceae bacterium]